MKRKTGTPPPSTVPTLRLVYDSDRDADTSKAQEQPTAVAHDTIATLEKLLHEARKGELVGLAYAALYSHRAYCGTATDDLRENPTFARGMVAMLDDELRRLVEGTHCH